MVTTQFYFNGENKPAWTFTRQSTAPRVNDMVFLPSNPMGAKVVNVRWFYGEDGTSYVEIELERLEVSNKRFVTHP